jgi:diadenosine tetraphosphate (Ap4A) HIT family hydrolase
MGAPEVAVALVGLTAARQHVHVHVIPRRLGDWANNDDVYAEASGLPSRPRPPCCV